MEEKTMLTTEAEEDVLFKKQENETQEKPQEGKTDEAVQDKPFSIVLSRLKTVWGKIAPYWKGTVSVLSKFVWTFPPIIVLIAMFVFFNKNGFYPFGDKTISWCDMDQQTVPLLLDLKDILSGKEGLLLNFKNAGGMNFYGVFFFFLSSPFSLLVAFVEKSKIALFANVLVTLKMCTAACTASIYLYKKHPRTFLLNIGLSVLYAFSGYTMLYFQNLMWLDMLYLFPLLLLALDKLKEGKRVWFILVLSACVFVNYYLSYMIVVFLLLYAFVWLIMTKDKKFATNFGIACAIAALATAIVWLPSLIQYFSSGRRTSLQDSLSGSSMFTAYTTTLPTIFSILFLFPFALLRKENATKDNILRRILWLASLVPLVLEPINKMWQTGNYMSFPTRYAFIPIFLCITLAVDTMEKMPSKATETAPKNAPKEDCNVWRKIKKHLPMYAISIFLVLLSVWYYAFAKQYTDANHETMDQYSHSLWGNAASFEALLKLYAMALMIGVVWYIVWRFHLFKPIFLWTAVSVLVASELYVAPITYMTAASHNVDWHLQAMELCNVIEDDGFYRVKSDKEYSGHDFDANLMGSIGYNALGHYTSLTSTNYMQAIKQFGYTSYWMEVGNSGGTILTDALLSVKYSISSAKTDEDVFQGEYYNISKTPYYLPLGVVTQTDIVKNWQGAEGVYPRAQMQSRLYEEFFGTAEGVQTYGLSEAKLSGVEVKEENGKYLLTPKSSNASIIFNITVTEKQTLYFNAFDESDHSLNQAINKKFSVSAPGSSVSQYPTQKQNGVLKLGEYENQRISVTVGVKSAVTVRDISVFGIEHGRLEQDIQNAKTVGLTAGKNSLSGSYTAEGGECVFLSVAYDEGMTLKINGEKTKLYEVYDGFTAFYLKEGENDIRLTFAPKGFGLGIAVTVVGVGIFAAAFVLWIWKKRRLDLPEWVDAVAYYGLLTVGIFVIFAVYWLPMWLCVT